MSLEYSRVARPIGEPRGRSLGWWGAVLGLIALLHLVVAAQVATVYLRAASPTWPPLGGEPPGMVTSALAAGLLVATAAVTLLADVGTRRGRGLAPFLLPMAAVGAAVAGWLRGSVTIFSEHPVTDQAFWSVRWLLGAIDVTLAWSLTLILVVAAVHTWRGVIRPGDHSELAFVSLWSWATAGMVVGSWLVFAGVTNWWGGV